jgi:hypothetical protein
MQIISRLRNIIGVIFLMSSAIFFANTAYSNFNSATLSTEPNLPINGWQQLFNGKNLQGWQHVGKGKFTINQGLLQSNGNMGILWYTKQKFGDCVIRVVYKVNDPATDSGIFVRIAQPPKNPWDVVNNGIEIQIKDTEDSYHRTGAIYSLAQASVAPTNPVGQWNTMDIFLSGENIIVYVNSSLVSQYTSGQTSPPQKASTEPNRSNVRPAYGYIGVQNQDEQINGQTSHIWFKSISILPVSDSSS